MRRLTGMFLIVAGTASWAIAGGVSVPEIDSAAAASGLAVLAGALVIIRARRRR